MEHMPFVHRISRCPIAFDPDAGRDTRSHFADLPPELCDVIAGAAGCSPYLKGLMGQEESWLRAALLAPPETAVNDVLATLNNQPLEGLGSALRRAKRRTALITALADLAGVWPLEQITATLSHLADLAVDLCLNRLCADEIRRGKLPGQQAGDAQTACGMFALAMGKGGAYELNYSSDIDLICLFDQDRYDDHWQDARSAFIRITRKMTALLSDVTSEGYVFRTDLRLRPDAAVTPVCISVAAAEAYYEAQGRTWERAAFIKARACAGDIAAGNRFLRSLTPFVWRRHLDFAAIQDAYDMRLRIRDHRDLHGPIVLEGHNMKLGVGGIREIEFYTQTRQLIAGGRDPDLRDPTTTGALAALAQKGWLPTQTAQRLTALYRSHRDIEHRIQMVFDTQTHDLPATLDGIARIAYMCGQDDVDLFRKTLLEQLHETDRLTDDFFTPDRAQSGPELSPNARTIVEGWQRYPALKSPRAGKIFDRLRPKFLQALQKARNFDEALLSLDGFLAGLPAGVQVFSLFEANPVLIDLIIDIAGTSPELAKYLSRNAAVLDAVIGGSFWQAWPQGVALREGLDTVLAPLDDYEKKLDAARRWMKEWHFQIGVHHLRGLIDGFEAGKNHADLAEAVIQGLWPVICAEFARKHGDAPGDGAAILGMGSIGAGQLNALSDLDLIVIYDAKGVEASQGPRPLDSRNYYARLTQAMVTALSAPMAEGRLYEVDTRLRPSGRKGPVATSLQSFKDYQMNDAWTWEHLALTRARVLAGPAQLAGTIETVRRDIIAAKSGSDTILPDVAEMREKLAQGKQASGPLDAKNGAGRLMDIELLAQTFALRTGSAQRRTLQQLRLGHKAGLLGQDETETLITAYQALWQLQAASRLLGPDITHDDRLGEGGRQFMLHACGQHDLTELSLHINRQTEQAAHIINTYLKGATHADH